MHTRTRYGVDVAVRRADDLDKKCLAHIQAKPRPRVLDLGCGAGGQSLRLALVGARVTAVDRGDYAALFASLREEHALPYESLEFITGTLEHLPNLIGNHQFDDVVCQRALHYLSYPAAQQLLQYLHSITTDTIFIAVTGLETSVAVGYEELDLPIESRFTKPAPAVQATHGICEPICLYRQSELIQLLSATGWHVRDCWVSAFGNIKAIATH